MRNHQCEACGTPTPMQYDYVDRHGDIEQLCAACYTLALEGNESPELARRDRRVAWVLAAIGAVLLLWLTGCATGEIRRSVVNGETLIEHIDTTDQPAKCGRWTNSGCFQLRLVNERLEKHIWKSSVGQAYVARHEDAHRKGMWHTEAKRHPMYNLVLTAYQQSQARNVVLCSTITAGAPGYPLGHLLCNDGRSEWTIAP